MLTKKDLMAIKVLVDESVDSFRTEFRNEIMKELRNEIIKFKDEILAELEKIRQDFVVMKGYKDELEDHENTLTELELIHPQGKHLQ